MKVISFTHLSRLSKDSPGYVDWTEKLDIICSRLLPTFKLQVGSDKILVESTARILSPIGYILVYALGGSENWFLFFLDQ